MQMSEQELTVILQRNPHIRIHEDRRPSNTRQQAEIPADILEGKCAKYRNSRVYLYEDGFIFFSGKETGHGKVLKKYDSVREFRRQQELILMEKAGVIHDLNWQYKLVLQDGFIHEGKKISPITYVADFFYYRKDDEMPTIEDVKGYDVKKRKHITTETFRLKWKMAMRRYPNFHFEIF